MSVPLIVGMVGLQALGWVRLASLLKGPEPGTTEYDAWLREQAERKAAEALKRENKERARVAWLAARAAADARRARAAAAVMRTAALPTPVKVYADEADAAAAAAKSAKSVVQAGKAANKAKWAADKAVAAAAKATKEAAREAALRATNGASNAAEADAKRAAAAAAQAAADASAAALVAGNSSIAKAAASSALRAAGVAKSQAGAARAAHASILKDVGNAGTAKRGSAAARTAADAAQRAAQDAAAALRAAQAAAKAAADADAAEKARRAAADAAKARQAASDAAAAAKARQAAADAAAAETARRAAADAAANAAAAAKARQAAADAAAADKARKAAADKAAADKARLGAADAAAAENARKAAADAAAKAAAEKARMVGKSTAPSGDSALDTLSHGLAGAMGAFSSLAGSLLSSLNTPTGKAAVGGTLVAGALLLLRARRGNKGSNSTSVVNGSVGKNASAISTPGADANSNKLRKTSGNTLGSGFDEVIIALLRLPKRTPGEEARLKALLLLLSQSQPQPQGALGSDGDKPGTWRLVWAEKPLFWVWRGLDPLLTPAEQAMDTGAGTLASSATAGPVTVTARGSFTPAKTSSIWGSKPEFELDVNDGSIALDVGQLKMTLPLLAKGGGHWQVVYADARLRVFHSDEAGLAAQLLGTLVDK